MDLIKIGKYIAGKRKGLDMTQKQLAEKLGMSDKSVSKWERGICLPDVSIYSDLCSLLGISINEFLAGEDIDQGNLIQRSEETIIEVVTDHKQKQEGLKRIILLMLVITTLAILMIGVAIYQAGKPQNEIVQVERDSVERQVAELFAGPDGAYVYKFTTTDDYSQLKLYCSEYQSGKLVNKEDVGLGFEGIGSPKNGEILIVPDFSNYVIRLIIATDGTKLSTEFPILDGVEGREHFGRSASEIKGKTEIRYNEEQALVACIYDNDEMRVVDLSYFTDGATEALAQNDYLYYFSFEFCKE